MFFLYYFEIIYFSIYFNNYYFREAVSLLDHIKSIASFNVEIKKLDPKKENLKLLPKVMDKIQDPIQSFILQASPCEKLIGNDTFLRFLYDHFYKIDLPLPSDSENALKYIQEHDSNWYCLIKQFWIVFYYRFNGISPQMMETLFGVVYLQYFDCSILNYNRLIILHPNSMKLL